MNPLKYYLGCLMALPMLPFMYVQGKKIRKSFPRFPEASGPEGTFDVKSPKTLKVLILGESAMAGVGVKSHQEGFAGVFAKNLSEKLGKNIHWKVAAKGGYTVKRLRYKIVPQVEAEKFDLIAIGMGANDAFQLNSPLTWRKNILELINACQDRFPNTPIAFLNMPPIKEFPALSGSIKFTVGNLVELYGEQLEAIASTQEGIYYSSEVVTLDQWIKKLNDGLDESDFFSDGIHPSQLTYRLWAEDFANFVYREVQSIR